MLKNSLMLHAGSHDIKIGGEADRIWIDDRFGYTQFGSFVTFSSSPDEILDILTPGGRIANRFDAPGIFMLEMGNTLGQQRLGHAALYLQDSWRVAPALTVDLGFRWAGQFNQLPEVDNELLRERVQRARFPFGQVDPAYLPDDLSQWMPRLGFAYAPQGLSRQLVVRGSFGVFHAVTPPVFFNAATKAFRDPPFNLPVLLPTRQPTVYRQFLAAGIDLNHHRVAVGRANSQGPALPRLLTCSCPSLAASARFLSNSSLVSRGFQYQGWSTCSRDMIRSIADTTSG